MMIFTKHENMLKAKKANMKVIATTSKCDIIIK